MMEDKFTTSWKEKIQKHHAVVMECDKLAFANGFSMIYMVIWLLFCIPVALFTTIGKQYVIGWSASSKTLHLFVRNLWGGAGDKVISFPIHECQDLVVTDSLISFRDKNDQTYKLHSVGMGYARKNFPLIGKDMQS